VNQPNQNTTTKNFLTPDFLLQNKFAQRLYHDYAAPLPCIDFHCHLSPEEIATNKKFSNLSEIWLKGDHYKWRAMRAMGVNENYITGNATDEEKFHAWANVVPQTIRNPLFHWTHMELQKPFGIDEYLNADTASGIYQHCNDLLQQDAFSTQGILHKSKVEFVGTTDDPCDDLRFHQQLMKDNCTIAVKPSFRPDKVLNISNKTAFLNYLKQLEIASAVAITDINSLLQALQNRVDYFHTNGCIVSDHGLSKMPVVAAFSQSLETEFANFIANNTVTHYSSPDIFAGFILLELCKMYHVKGWIQQFHLGPLRDNNKRLLTQLGENTGFDSIGDFPQALALSKFLDCLDSTSQLTKTIIYNINPADNDMFACMAGNFNDGTIKGKVQYGPAWWFLDQKDGIEKQMNALSNMGLISTFIGMITDSRSFLSYSRHEYFRRILCNMFGEEMEKGLLPTDEKWIGKIVQQISYYNAKEYFNS
jgi:glucuronate isomerase